MNPVTAQLEKLSIPTYGLGQPEKNPVFFETRVYQGSCGKVYPVPFIDKVYQDEPPKPVDYVAARLENEFVRLVMLPEIGGRIFLGQDKAKPVLALPEDTCRFQRPAVQRQAVAKAGDAVGREGAGDPHLVLLLQDRGRRDDGPRHHAV
jgi:hypothetical protein